MWWTKLMSQNSFAQNLTLWQDAKREISLVWTFTTWHVWVWFEYTAITKILEICLGVVSYHLPFWMLFLKYGECLELYRLEITLTYHLKHGHISQRNDEQLGHKQQCTSDLHVHDDVKPTCTHYVLCQLHRWAWPPALYCILLPCTSPAPQIRSLYRFW